jgi:maleate cis-trans isomerase
MFKGEGPIEFLRMLDEYAQKCNLSREDAYYSLMGYPHDNSLSASDRFKYRKMYYTGQKKELRKLLKVNSDVTLVKALKSLDCIKSGDSLYAKKSLGLSPYLEELARILSDYFSNTEEKILNSTSGAVSLSSYMKNYQYVTDKSVLSTLLNSDTFKKIIQFSLPQFVVKEGKENCISQNVFFLSKMITAEEMKQVVNAAVSHCVLKILDVPEKVYLFVVDNAASYHLHTGVYLQMIDYANNLGVSVKQLFELCGLSHVDNLEIYQQTGGIFYRLGPNKFLIFATNSKERNNFVILSESQLGGFIEVGALKTLNWDKKGASIFVGNKVYLKEWYRESAENDYSGG